jgi:hypothetical protein
MSGYTGRLADATQESASASKIVVADSARRLTLDDKVLLVKRYIQNAARAHGGSLRLVPCPPAKEWDLLSIGYNPQLPSPTVMSLYGTDVMHKAVRAGGSYRELFWDEALAMVG